MPYVALLFAIMMTASLVAGFAFLVDLALDNKYYPWTTKRRRLTNACVWLLIAAIWGGMSHFFYYWT